jgi:hypothetical protein
MRSKFFIYSLWTTTLAIVLLSAIQVLSGNWVTYFFLFPGGPNYGERFMRAMADLGTYHKIMGFVIGALSITIPPLAFLARANNYVKVFSLLGFVVTILAAIGGVAYVNSGFGDRLGLGQMADAAVGVFVAFFLQLFFMNQVPRFPWNKEKTTLK